MTIISYYNSISDLRILLEAYMEYENISIIAGQDDIPDFKATIIVVVGQENYKPSWNKYQVHLLAMKQDFVAVAIKYKQKNIT